MTLLENRIFAEDASELTLPQSGPEVQHPVSLKEKERTQERQVCKEERDEIEIRAILSQAKELVCLPEAGKR